MLSVTLAIKKLFTFAASNPVMSCNLDSGPATTCTYFKPFVLIFFIFLLEFVLIQFNVAILLQT